MSSFGLCDVCRGTCSGGCPHFTDLNRAIPIFREPEGGVARGHDALHEFHFFGHDDTVPWAFDDAKYRDQPPQVLTPAGFQLFDSLGHEAGGGDPRRGLTFEVCLNDAASEQTPNAALNSADCLAMTASSATTMSISGSTMTDASSGRSNGKEGCCNTPTADVAGQLDDTAVEREIKVRRYKEKRNRRRYEKQIRYASRKAYAEMRPRIKGRFAKAHVAQQETSQEASLLPPKSDQDRSINLRWFPS